MELIAAIDLLGGRARRLEQGDYKRPIAQSADPLELAREWLAAGLRWLHVIDLDGARVGRPVNGAMLGQLCRLAAAHGGRSQAGGGLRTAAAVEATLDAGADVALLGSAAFSDPAFAAECARRWPGRMAVSVDVRDGRLAVHGWQRTMAQDPFALADDLLASGIRRLVATDTQRDGTGAGPNLALLAEFRRRQPAAELIAAGGIASPADLADLANLGIDGAIVGRALLDGSLEIGAALAASGAGAPA